MICFRFVFAFLTTCVAAAAVAEDRPNILIAIADDQSYPHASAYGCGWVKTPAFDEIARRGVLYGGLLAFARLLGTVEPLLAARPFLFGERFTLADASLYGQLAINRNDPSAWAWIAREAPASAAWIERLLVGDFAGDDPDGRLALDAEVAPLLAWACASFVPLMRQNEAAFERHRAAGETRWNEAAFDAGRALYDGSLLGRPFRSVAKTFQVRVWRDLRAGWDALPAPARTRLEARLPAGHGLDRTGEVS